MYGLPKNHYHPRSCQCHEQNSVQLSDMKCVQINFEPKQAWYSAACFSQNLKDFCANKQKGRQITQWLVSPLTAHSSGSRRSTHVPMVLSWQRAYTPALLNDVGGRLHLSGSHHAIWLEDFQFQDSGNLEYKDETLSIFHHIWFTQAYKIYQSHVRFETWKLGLLCVVQQCSVTVLDWLLTAQTQM